MLLITIIRGNICSFLAKLFLVRWQPLMSIQCWPLYLVNVIKPAIISEHFRGYRSTIRTLEKKRHGLPVHQCYHAAFALKQWNGAKTALGLRYGNWRFLPNANCGENILSRGQNGRVGRVSGNKTFFWPQSIGEGIPIPDSLGEEATFINICISNWGQKCQRGLISTMPSFGSKVICWYTGFTFETFI